MKLYIGWNYKKEQKNVIFKQKITIAKNVTFTPTFCVGSQIVNVYNACYADALLRFTEKRFINLFDFKSEVYNFNENEFGNLCYISECMESIAEMLFDNIKRECQSICKYINNDDNVEEKFFLSKTCFHENDYQNAINEYLSDYNSLFDNFFSCLSEKVFDYSFYNELIAVMKKYNIGENNLLNKYLLKNDGRCFATFIERNEQTKYVALSGFIDCRDKNILKWLNTNQWKEFIQTITNICKELNAELVTSNLNIADFSCDNCNNLRIKYTLGEAIKKQFDKSIKRDFACAERKLFGRFNNATPSGSLFIKFEMCCKCCKAYNYQIEKGSTIYVIAGLGV